MLDNTLDNNYVTQMDSKQLRTKACDFINQSLITLLCKDGSTGKSFKIILSKVRLFYKSD